MKRSQDCDFVLLFITKEDLDKYIKCLCKMKLWHKLQKEEVVGKCSVKKMFLKVSQNSDENTCVRASSLIKLQASGLKIYFKKDSDKDVFLWILWNFLKTISLKNTYGGFWTKDLFPLIFKQTFFQLSGFSRTRSETRKLQKPQKPRKSQKKVVKQCNCIIYH